VEIPNHQGLVYDIQRFCLHDGPGVRTLVFFKGCTLRCLWCANPESQEFHPDLLNSRDRCIGCGSCLSVCPTGAISKGADGVEVDRAKCTVCGECAERCPTGALRISGKAMSVANLVIEVERDRCFFDESGGGVTVSGGEPLVQADILRDLLSRLKSRNINTAIETAGNVPWASFEKTLDCTDLYLYDLKHPHPQAHREGTGCGNDWILTNLEMLSSLGKKIIIRYPVIPGFNTGEAVVRGIGALVKRLRIGDIDLLPFHRLGTGKYRQLGRDYEYEEILPMREEELEKIKRCIETESGSNVRIIL
jgi:pyruvate formate lyase activating enzyme